MWIRLNCLAGIYSTIFFPKGNEVEREETHFGSNQDQLIPLCLLTSGYAALIIHKTTGHIGFNPAVIAKLAGVKLRKRKRPVH